jgi:hypothetical protein
MKTNRFPIAAAVLLCVLGAPGSVLAGLRATIRIEMKAPTGGPGMPGGAPMAPKGPIDMIWSTQDGVVRTEILGDMPGMPKGTVTLRKVGDPSMYVINPANQTYYMVKAGGPSRLPQPTSVSIKRTGEFETIAGHKAEKVLLDSRVPVPLPYGMQPPPGVATEMQITGEIWTTDDFGDRPEYRLVLEELNKISGFAGADTSKDVKFPLKLRLTMSMMMTMEVVSTVTAITDDKLPPDLFAMPPAGYKEVQPPFPYPGMRPPQ